MSRRFDRLHVLSKSTKVAPERIDELLQRHQLMLKIIWSGFGASRHQNRAHECAQWDMADWDYLINQFKDPENNRPVYGVSNSGSARNWTVMGDDRDRSQYYSIERRAWVRRHDVRYQRRGRSKPGKQTIKSGHYSLLPPHGRMTYCRGIDPKTGRMARSGEANFYEASSKSFPSRQIGWLFSADVADGGVVKHCCEKDMYGRRLPWLGGAEAAKYAMRNSPYRGSSLPDLVHVDVLRSRQRRDHGYELPHNDCRFKPTKKTIAAIMIPDDRPGHPSGYLAKLNGLHKKLYVMQTLGIDCPLVIKAYNSKQFKQVDDLGLWGIVIDAQELFPELIPTLPLQLLPMNAGIFTGIRSLLQQKYRHLRAEVIESKVVKLLMAACGSHPPTVRRLNDPALLEGLVAAHASDDAICMLIQAGASIESRKVLTYLMQRWRDFRVVLAPARKAEIMALVKQHMLAVLLDDNAAIAGDFKNDLVALYPGYDSVLSLSTLHNKLGLHVELCRRALVVRDPEFALSDERFKRIKNEVLIHALSRNKVELANAILRRANADTDLSADDYERLITDLIVHNDFSKCALANNRHLIAVIKQQAEACSPELATRILTKMLFKPGLQRALGAQKQACIAEFMASPVGLAELSAKQIWQLVAQADMHQHAAVVATFLLKPELHVDTLSADAAVCIKRFVISDEFSALPQVVRRQFFERYASVFERICPIGSIDQFRQFYDQVHRSAPSELPQLLSMGGGHNDYSLRYMAGRQTLSTIANFQQLLQPLLNDLRRKSRIRNFRVRRIIPALQALVRDVGSVRPIERADGQWVLSADDLAMLQQHMRHLNSYRQSAVLKSMLTNLQQIVDKAKQLNSSFNLGMPGPVLAAVPDYAMNVAAIDKYRQQRWRKHGYTHFQHMHALGSDKQTSVKVYTAGAIDDESLPALLMGLDRRSGYTMSQRQCAYTKRRVIVSDAALYRAESDDVPLSVVSAVAPNLGNDARFGNALDREFYLSSGRLNEAAYYRAMKVAWSLSFYALSQQAQQQSKRMVAVTPLLGGGAYLQGQSDSVREAAIRVHMRAMIDAYNAQQTDDIAEVHLCLPSPASQEDFDAYASLLKMRARLPQMHGRLCVSRSDAFELMEKTADSMDAATHCLGFVNPSSDRVPGGGCYKDRHAPVYLRTRSTQQARANRPGSLNLAPSALEEQVAQVTDFMYSQCASMNPKHLKFSSIHAVNVAVSGRITRRTEQLGDRYRDRPVVDALAELKPGLYPEVHRSVPEAGSHPAIRRRKSFSEQAADESVATIRRTNSSHALFAPHTIAHAKVAAAQPSRPGRIGGPVAAGVNTAAVSAARAATPAQLAHMLTSFIDELSRHSSGVLNALRGDKMAAVKKEITGTVTLSALTLTPALRQVIAQALLTRGASSSSATGRAAVKILNVRFPTLSAIIRESLTLPSATPLKYAHLQSFAHPAQPGASVGSAPARSLVIN